MDAPARLSILALATALGAWAGIRAHEHAAPPPSPEVVTELPVPAPKTLVAEGVAASPDATWRKAQETVGGVVLLAPPTFGGVLGAIAREPALSTVVDGGSPAYGVVGEGGAWVVAAHAISPQRARSTLVGDPAHGGLVVEGHEGTIDVMRAEGAWIGLAGGFVLVGSDRAALATLGPYAYRSLPVRPLPQSAVAARMTGAALQGPIREAMQRRWADVDAYLLAKDDEQRTAHGGRAPDLADPKAIVTELDAIEKTYEGRVAGMEKAELALDLDDDGLHARLTLTAPRRGEAGDWVDALEGGSTAPLAAASQGALATIFWRSDVNDRRRAAKEIGGTVTSALGSRVPAADEAKVGEIVGRIGEARAGWALASVSGGPETGALLRMATNEGPTISASLASLVDLVRGPAWAKWEADALGVTKITRDGSRATFVRPDANIQASWVERSGAVDLAVGADASAILASASGQVTMGSDAKVSSWLRSLQSSVVCAIVARPLLIASSPRSDALLVALVHGHGTAVLDLRAPGPVLRQLVVALMKGS